METPPHDLQDLKDLLPNIFVFVCSKQITVTVNRLIDKHPLKYRNNIYFPPKNVTVKWKYTLYYH